MTSPVAEPDPALGEIGEMATDSALKALMAGIEEGDCSAVRLYANALLLRPERFAVDQLLEYAERRKARLERRKWLAAQTPFSVARALMRRLSPRSRSYLRRARAIAARGKSRFGLNWEEYRALMAEASESRWRATHGLEYRFLVAFLQASDAVPEALQELRTSDFSSVPYAAMFRLAQAHGLEALDVAELVETKGFVPPLGRTWWAAEARTTFQEMLARRARFERLGYRRRRRSPRRDGASPDG